MPILAFASDGPFRQRLQEQAQQHMSKATHFDIFPTLLIAMGFDSGWVAKHYDASLLALPPARQRRFLVGDMFGAGKGVKWIDVK